MARILVIELYDGDEFDNRTPDQMAGLMSELVAPLEAMKEQAGIDYASIAMSWKTVA